MEPQQTTTTTVAAATTVSGDDIDGGPTTIVKGKRTKRQRLQSSIPFTILPQPSTSNNIIINPNSNSNSNSNPSPASSSDVPPGSATTEEEDTAKCLILLSQGHNLSPTTNIIINNNHEFSTYKFNSKRYIQTSTDTAVDGFTGIYVYECKTCSRTFPSFQALGGHRASHKKPRINEDKKRPPPPTPYTVFSDDDEPSLQFPSRKNNSSSSSSLSLQLNHRVSSTKKPSSKLHECSICGTEFNSGQALGGHMRRHRAATATTSAANTTLSLIPYGPVTTAMVADNYQKSRNDHHGLCLDLDLNLPAPPEASNQDHRREASFTFPAKQQSAVHLSAAPTLVDCHY